MSGSVAPLPSASLVVPTFDRRARLQRLLERLGSLLPRGARVEVVVVVDGSTDGTSEMLAALRPSYPLVALVQPRRGPAAARNRALAAAGGEVLVFIDDDALPLEGTIERHVEAHRDDPGIVAIGPMLQPAGRRLAPWLRWEAVTLGREYEKMRSGRYAPTPRQFFTANASVRREHARAVGGFDESFTRAEDVEFAYRLRDRGLRFHFVPDAGVLHDPDRSFESWRHIAYEYGRFDVALQERGRRHLEVAHRETSRRHPLSRVLVRSCIARPPLARATEAAFTAAIRAPVPVWAERFQLPLCGALYALRYWQGVADATGLGTQLWRHLDARAFEARGVSRGSRPAGDR